MKRVEFRWRMLRSREVGGGRIRNLQNLRYRQDSSRDQRYGMQRHLGRWQYAWRVRRHHRLAAIVGLIRGIARHRPTALHALRVLRHGGHAIRELQDQ